MITALGILNRGHWQERDQHTFCARRFRIFATASGVVLDDWP
jgi:hypothetical protein